MVPNAEGTEVVVHESIQLFDCGTNLERVLCPACAEEIALEWWQERMADDFDDGFKLAGYVVPCCGARYTLDMLVYEWPQGFGRFALAARNPGIRELSERGRQELEAILETRLRVVYQRT